MIYNWKELDEKFRLNSEDEHMFLDTLMKEGMFDALDEIDGAFAHAYEDDEKIMLARDIIGIKPLWYKVDKKLLFSDENKALKGKELDPKTILKYDKQSKKVELIKRPFFSINPSLPDNIDKIRRELAGLLIDAVAKRIPNSKFGIMFSGGIDSTLIAVIMKQLGVDFTCYTAVLGEEGMSTADDLIFAERIAEKMGFEHEVMKVKLSDVPGYLKKIVPYIESSNVVKAGVALPEFICCEQAKKDGIRIMFSGLGSEEIFAGYDRHDRSSDINEECLAGLSMMHERDCFRDYMVGKHFGIEIRVPFLDRKLVEYALRIPSGLKIQGGQKKIILRKIAEDLGIPGEFAQRPKKAAQYGSKFDRAILKLAKRNGFDFKKDYLEKFE